MTDFTTRRIGSPSLTAVSLATTATVAMAMMASSVHAQSLQELYTAARAFDASYLATRAQTESAEHRSSQSYALRRPSVNLAATVSRARTDPPPSQLNPTGQVINTDGRGFTVNARQALFNRQSDTTIEQSEKALEVARAELAIAEQDLVLRLVQAYFDVLSAQDVLTAAQAAKKSITEQLASAKRNFEVGTATITDQREAQARFDLATAQEIGAENDLRVKRLALDQLVGQTNVQPNKLAVPVVLPTVTPDSVDPWVERAQGEHPAARRAALAREIAKLETDKARAGHLPTLDLIGSVGPQRAINNDIGGTTTTASVGVQLAIPLYAGNSVQNRVKETLALEEKALNDWANVRRTLAQAARTAFIGVQSGQAQVKALEAAEGSSRLALEATQTGYRVGVRVNVDVLNAQSQLFQTQRDLAIARYNVVLGTLRLKQAAGQLGATDLASLDALLAKP